jgi:integrase
MPKRRAKGEGTLRYRKKDKLWEGRTPKINGQDKTIYARHQAVAIKKLKEAIRELESGSIFDAGTLTFGEHLSHWLNAIKHAVKDNSYDLYEALARNHLSDLAAIPLTSLSPAHLQDLYHRKLESLSPATVIQIHNVANQALKQAVKLRLIPYNPAEATTPPRKAGEEITPLNLEQTQRLVKVAWTKRMGSLVIVAVLTGLRVGELLGLKWDDIDLRKGTVEIKRQLLNPRGGMKFGPPKRKASQRLIVLPERATAALQWRRREQIEEELSSPMWADTGLVFTTLEGRPVLPANQARALKPLLKEAGCPIITFHGLRHTFATLSLKNGEHARVVQHALGHANISETMDTYSHVLPSMGKDAARRLNDLF